MKRTQLIGKVVDILCEFLGFNRSASPLRGLRAPDKRPLRLESLEGRNVLSATGLVSNDVEFLDASSPSSSSEVVISTPTVEATESIDYSLTTNATSSSEEEDMASLANVEIEWESIDPEIVNDATFGSEGEDSLQEVARDISTFEFNGVTYVLFEDADLYRATLENDQDGTGANDPDFSALLRQGGGDAPRSGGSGGSSEPEEFEIEVTSSLTSIITDLGVATGMPNPLLERRVLGSGGGDVLANSDYVSIALPALPDYYVGTVVVSGDVNSYLIYMDGTVNANFAMTSDTSRVMEYSGGSTSFIILPCNDAKPENNVVIVASLSVSPMDDSGGGDWIPEYDFDYVNQSVTVTIVDDDQWKISAVVTDDEALEGNPDVAGCNPTNGSFNVVRSMNLTADNYNLLCSAYTLDETYDIEINVATGGTATRNTDFQLLDGNNNSLSGSIVFSGNTTSIPINVAPIEDDLFEANEYVTLVLSNPTNQTGEHGENTLPQYEIGASSGSVTIYQAPEFTRNGDQSGVNLDKLDCDFKYGKPNVGDLVETLLVSSVNEYRLMIPDENSYFTISENGIVWDHLPDSTCNTYTFSVVVRAYDIYHEDSYDEITVKVTYGWATLTLCAVQPVAGSNALFTFSGGRMTGHVFWVIESTSSLKDYCASEYNITGSIPNHSLLTFAALASYNNGAWGYYPENVGIARLLSGDNGELRPDDSILGDVTAYAIFDVPSTGAFLDLLAATKAIDDDVNDKYYLQDMWGNSERNCVDEAIRIASIIGVSIETSQTEGYVLGYPFKGHAPGQFGVDLVNNYNGKRNSYSLHSTLPWSEEVPEE